MCLPRTLICIMAPVLLCGCASIPIPEVVSATQTEIAIAGADIASDIATVKEITDAAKTTGEIQKSSVQTVIKYVDKAAGDVAELNTLIDKQTKNITKMTIEMDKYKARAERLLRWLQLSICINLAFAVLVVLYILKRLK